MMRRRGSRPFLLVLSLIACSGLMLLSATGILSPLEGLAATPLNWLSGIFYRVGLSFSGNAEALQELDDLRERNAELETALARLQAEVVPLREISIDYNRLAALVGYTSSTRNLEFVSADVINRDTSRSLRTININKGTRDGIRVGMPVVTELGLVGRILDVSSTFSRVMLVTSDDSSISARLQTSREEGSVIGRSESSMQMVMLPLNANVQAGDLVLTSGLGGLLPPDLVIGQVESVRRSEAASEQEAVIRSLIDFNRLEIVLVVTSFEPVDFSIFESTPEG
jgi:rod shape-determining protein MreC